MCSQSARFSLARCVRARVRASDDSVYFSGRAHALIGGNHIQGVRTRFRAHMRCCAAVLCSVREPAEICGTKLLLTRARVSLRRRRQRRRRQYYYYSCALTVVLIIWRVAIFRMDICAEFCLTTESIVESLHTTFSYLPYLMLVKDMRVMHWKRF